MVYAIATQDSVFVYDTQQHNPLAMISSLHYATLTDLAWQVLFMSEFLQDHCCFNRFQLLGRQMEILWLLRL